MERLDKLGLGIWFVSLLLVSAMVVLDGTDEDSDPEDPIEYPVVGGNGGIWDRPFDEFIVTIKADCSKFTGLKINGFPVDESNYTISSGSAVITLKPDYLRTLSDGTHSLEFLFNDGNASMTLTVSVEAKILKIEELESLLADYDKDDYSEEDWTSLVDFITAAKLEIVNLEDVSEVETFDIGNVKTECDDVRTLAEIKESFLDELQNRIDGLNGTDGFNITLNGEDLTVESENTADVPDILDAISDLADILENLFGTNAKLTVNGKDFILGDVNLTELAEALLEDSDDGLPDGKEIDAEYAVSVRYENVNIGLNGILSLYAIWNINQYTITFDTDGGSSVDSIKQDYGTSVKAPAGPTRTGYSFAGWNPAIPETMPAENITITAQWSVNQYTITFDSAGGTDVDPIKQDYGTSVKAPADPTRTGYTFAGWNPAIPETMPAENITITAEWSINQYTITFDSAGGTDVDPIKQDYGTSVTAPADPTRTGYTFVEWDTEIPAKMPATDMTVTAVWKINQYTITFDNNGGAGTIPAVDKDFEETVTVPAYGFTKIGYTQIGWNTAADGSGTSYEKDGTFDMPADDITLYAVWKINQYTITFDSAGGTDVDSIEQDYDTSVTAPADPTRTGYTFVEWDTEIPAKMPATDMTVTAVWKINQYTITFDNNGGAGTIPAVDKDFEETVTVPAYGFTKIGYTQIGWNTAADGSGTSYEKDGTFDMPADDITLYAVWKINRYTITFDSAGGTDVDPIKQDYGTSVTAPADPTRTGYTFVEWDTEIPAKMPATDMTVTAVWKINQYTITFDNNGGAGTIPAVDKDFEETVTVPAYGFTKIGYTQIGWNTAADGSGTSYEKDGTFDMPADDITLYAVWKINQYTITFDSAGGTDVDSIEQDYGTSVTAPADPTRTGYTFVEWDTEIPAKMPATDMTVTAVWKINQYTITFDNNGGAGTIPAVDKDFEETVTVPAYGFTKIGYTQIGWNTAADGSGTSYEKDGTFDMPADDITLYAVWKINRYTITFDSAGGTDVDPIKQDYGTSVTAPADPTRTGYTFVEWDTEIPAKMPATDMTVTAVWKINQYTITFDNNGGAGTIPAVDKDFEETVTVPAYGFTKIGYTQIGWNTAADGSGTSYEKDGTFDMPADDITLYAVWKINRYTITFDSAGGTDVDSIEQDYGTSVTAPADPTRTGYTFVEWDTEIPAKMPATDMTVTAVWKINQYTITFDNNGGAGTIPAVDKDFEETVTVPAYGFTKIGYTQIGWNTAADGSGTSYEKDGTFDMPADDITLYAVWKINQYTITFDSAGGTDVDSIEQDYGTSVTAPADPTRTGYTFVEWDTEIPAKMPATDMTVTAVWKINQYTITFDNNGGAGTIPAVDKDFEETVTVPAYGFTKIGYTQIGWNTAADGSGTSYEKDGTFDMPADDITLYAVWKINQYTITFDSAGGTDVDPIKQDYGTSVTAPADPTRTGYTFVEWDTEIPAKMPATDMTVTAVWKINQYTITFDNNGGAGTIPAVDKDFEETVTVPAYGFTKIGYTQIGWNTAADGSGTSYEKDGTFDMPADDITLYAVWKINRYTITFDSAGGTDVDPIKQDYGTSVTAPADPTRTGYTFVEWDTEIPAKMPATDMTVTAVWKINQYTITFDNNGGAGTIPAVDKDFEETVTVPAYGFTKIGYTQIGWNTAADGSGTSYEKDGTFDMPADDITLYAVWKINRYTITFDSAGGTDVDSIEQDYGTSVTAPADPTRTGYTFVEWDTEIPAKMPATDMTVTAVWKINQYTITFDNNGGAGTIPAVDKDFEETVTVPAYGFTKIGYTQIGWNTAADGSGTSYEKDGTFDMPADDITLYAVWKINQYTITFDSAGGTDVDSIEQDYGTSVTAPADPTREGFVFMGWNQTVPEIMPAENLELLAIWEYPIVGGKEGMWNKPLNEFTVTVEADYSKFTGLKIDGNPVDESNYSVVSGSTIVTLNLDYLWTLGDGEYDIDILFDDGNASMILTVFADAKILKIKELDTLLAKYDENDYGEIYWTALLEYVMSAKEEISNLDDIEKVENYDTNAVEGNCDDVKTLAELKGSFLAALQDEITILNGTDGIHVALVDENITVKIKDNVSISVVFNAASEMVNALKNIVGNDSTLTINGQEFTLYDDGLLPALVTAILNETTPEEFLDKGDPVSVGYAANIAYEDANITLDGCLNFKAVGTREMLLITLQTKIDELNKTEGINVILNVEDAAVDIAVEFDDNVPIPVVLNAASNLVEILKKIVDPEESTLKLGSSDKTFTLLDEGLLPALVVALLADTTPEEFLLNKLEVSTDYIASLLHKDEYIPLEGKLSFKVIETTCEVIFRDYNGNVLKEETVIYREGATPPNNPDNKKGYRFIGWDTSYDCILTDLVITAQYEICQYTVTFYTDGGSAVDSITEDYDTSVEGPDNPVRGGYIFYGWYNSEGEEVTFPFNMPVGGLNLTAMWKIGISVPVGKELTYNGANQLGADGGTGYTLETGKNQTNVGDYTVTATLNDGYLWVIPGENGGDMYSIEPQVISWSIVKTKLTVKADDVTVIFGNEPVYTVTYIGLVGDDSESALGGKLTFNTGYDADSNVYKETYVITPSGLTSPNYDIEFISGTLTVNKIKIDVPAAISDLIYNGSEQTGVLEGEGYTLTGNYKGTDAGNYVATVTLVNGYIWIIPGENGGENTYTADPQEINWSIGQKNIAGAVVTLDGTSLVYTGFAIKPGVTSVTLDGKILVAGTEYTVSHGENINVVTGGSVVVTGEGNYTGTVTATFVITKEKLTLPAENTTLFIYTGKEQTYDISGFDPDTMGIENNTRTEAGFQTVIVSIKDKANYEWADETDDDVKFTFTISPKELDISEEFGLVAVDRVYNGNDAEFIFVFMDRVLDYTLLVNTDYTVTVTGVNGIRDVGTVTVTVTSVDGSNYSVSATKEINITPKIIELDLTGENTSKIYDGKVAVFDFEFNVNYPIYTLKENTDYTIEFLRGSYDTTDFLNVGTITVNIKPVDGSNYSVSGTMSFTILKAELTATYAGETVEYGTTPGLFVTVTGFVNGENETAAGYAAPSLINTNVNAGKYQLAPSGGEADNYTFKYVEGQLEITRVKLDKPTADPTEFVYTGNVQTYNPIGFVESTMGIENNTRTEAGSQTVTVFIKDKVNYEWADGTNVCVAFESFNILKADFSDFEVNIIVDDEERVYDGTAKTPDVTVKIDSKELEKDRDYTVSYDNNVNAGEAAKVIITGIGNFKGFTSEVFIISPKDISVTGASITGKYTFVGEAITPNPVFTDTFVTENDYSATYDDPINAGTVTVTITGKGNYTGNTTVTFTIMKKTVTVTPNAGLSKIYGDADPELTYTLDDEDALPFIKEGTVLSRVDGKNVGTYAILLGTLELCGTDNYVLEFTVGVTFEIIPKPLTEGMFVIDSQTYTGSVLTPIIISDIDCNEYTVADINPVGAGDYVVSISAVTDGNYSGSVTVKYTIEKAKLTKPVEDETVFVYSGSEQIYAPKGFDTGTMNILGNKMTYVGTQDVTVSIKNKDNYEWIDGTDAGVIFTFTIKEKIFDFSAAETSVSDTKYTGLSITFDFDGKFVDSTIDEGYTLLEGKDYVVEYTDNKNVGTATITITGKGNYEGAVIVKFKITPKEITVTPKSGQTVEYTGYAPDVKFDFPESFGTFEDFTGTLDLAKDGQPVTVYNVGEYTVVLGDLKSTDPNYELVLATGTVTFEITPKKIIATPAAGQSAEYGTGFSLEFSLSETGFTDYGGVLGLEKDNSPVTVYNVGQYVIVIGTLASTDDNYMLILAESPVIFEIFKAELIKPAKGTTEFIYTGEEQTYDISGFNPDTMDIAGNKMTDAGSQTVIVSIKDKTNYQWADKTEGDVTFTFTIGERNISDVTITIDPNANLTYTGLVIEPGITVTLDGNPFNTSNYSVSYANNINAGTATVKITAKGTNYDGTATKDFVISKAKLTATYAGESVEYGTIPGLVVTVTGFVNNENAGNAMGYNAPRLTNSNVNVGKYQLTPSDGAANNYSFDYATGTLSIIKKKVNVLIGTGQTAEYTGAAPAINYELSETVDTTVTGTLSIGEVYNVGIYNILIGTLDAGSNYELVRPETPVTFEIIPKNISGATVGAIPDQTYTGSAIIPDLVVKDGSKTLTAGTDYEVSFAGGVDNTNVGNVAVTVTGIGNYKGTVDGVTFSIIQKNISGVNVTVTFTDGVYSVTAMDGDRTLEEDVDYEVETAGNPLVKITVKGKGNYTGEVSFEIYTISFVVENGNTIADIYNLQKDDVVTLENPSREGYEFTGWYIDSEGEEVTGSNIWTFVNKAINNVITLTAVFEPCKYTITFDSAGGSTVDSITQDYMSKVNAPGYPVKTGYNFVHWKDSDGNEVIFPTAMPLGGMKLTAVWSINQYTITFDTDGGSTVDSITQDYGTTIDSLNDPTKEGYTFAGWYPIVPATMPANNFTITALWTVNQYTIELNPADGFVIEDGDGSYTVKGSYTDNSIVKDVINEILSVSIHCNDIDISDVFDISYYDMSGNEIFVLDLSKGGTTFMIRLKATPDSNEHSSFGCWVIFKYGSVTIGKESTDYLTIEDALEQASSDQTIIVKYNTSFADEDVALQVYGKTVFEVGSGVTLLLPYDGNLRSDFTDAKLDAEAGEATTPSKRDVAYVKLNVPESISLDVSGTLTVNAKRTHSSTAYQNIVSGKNYSELILNSGSRLNIEQYGVLNAIGFIYGDGHIKASGGATVLETMLISSFRGGSASLSLGLDGKVFPFEQFTIINIESDLIIEKDAVYKAHIFVYASSTYTGSDVNLIGNSANSMLCLSEGHILKKFDAATGNLTLEVEGTCNLQDISANGFSSRGLNLPFDGRWHIVVKSGSVLNINSEVSLLPGASVVVEADSVVNINGGLIVFNPYEYIYADNKTYNEFPTPNASHWYRIQPTLGYKSDTSAKLEVYGQLNVNKDGYIAGKVDVMADDVLNIEEGAETSKYIWYVGEVSTVFERAVKLWLDETYTISVTVDNPTTKVDETFSAVVTALVKSKYGTPIANKSVSFRLPGDDTVYYATTDGKGYAKITLEVTPSESGYCIIRVDVDDSFAEGIIEVTKSSGGGGSCLSPDTLITLADGTQKPVEELTGDELLLVWNMNTGTFDVAPIIFVDSDPHAEYEIIQVNFSDGTYVKVIYEHGFWDFDLNRYVYINDDCPQQYIGHWFNKQTTDADGNFAWTKVQLVDVVIYTEYTTAWSPVTAEHLCYYTNGMLSMPGGIAGLFNIFEVNPETMEIDQEAYLADIAEYGLFTYEEFSEILFVPEEVFDIFQAKYFKIAIGKGLIDMDRLVKLVERYGGMLGMEL